MHHVQAIQGPTQEHVNCVVEQMPLLSEYTGGKAEADL